MLDAFLNLSEEDQTPNYVRFVRKWDKKKKKSNSSSHKVFFGQDWLVTGCVNRGVTGGNSCISHRFICHRFNGGSSQLLTFNRLPLLDWFRPLIYLFILTAGFFLFCFVFFSPCQFLLQGIESGES